MICPKCQTQNIDGVTFCGACGAQMNPLPEINSIGGSSANVPPPLPNYGSSAAEGASSYGAQQQQQQQYRQQQGQSATTYTHSTSAGQPSYASGGMETPKNYMVESIINAVVSFFCCGSLISTILAVIAIIKANNVTSAFNAGRYDEARRNANSAKTLNIWAIVIDVLWLIICIILYLFVGGLALLGGLGGLLSS